MLTGAGQALLRATAPGGRGRRERTHHAGRTVWSYAGPAVAPGTAVAAARVGPAAGVCGACDDVAGDDRRGFGAPLGALRHGEVASAAVKLFGSPRPGRRRDAGLKERPVDRVPAGVVIAGPRTSSTWSTYPGTSGGT
ncbi:hypothetical protein [Streptomyces collinus]|uniref:hypothetical protein n=1 Tax=Streptomyces collinus TaxID=42684 RepID=UPI003EC11901